MENLLKTQKSLIISSLGKNGDPEISYAPFIMMNNKIYVYLSKVKSHYYNLRDNHKCSVLIIEDESKCTTIFARTRVSFNCEAKLLENVDEKIFKEFDENHDAKMMSMLKAMDFDMFELNIKDGVLVQGFGKASEVSIVDGEFKFTPIVSRPNSGNHGRVHN